jgi:hypothetical protein
LRCDQRAKVLGIKFYSFPADNQKTKDKRRQWIAALNRHNFTPSRSHAVCGRHFVSGKPSNDVNDIDFRPTKYLKGGDFAPIPSYQHKPNEQQTNRRKERAAKRIAQKDEKACFEEITEVIIYCNVIVFSKEIKGSAL